MLVVNDAQHWLAITVMGLLKPGDVVAVDALTYQDDHLVLINKLAGLLSLSGKNLQNLDSVIIAQYRYLPAAPWSTALISVLPG